MNKASHFSLCFHIHFEVKNSLFLQCWLSRPGPGPNIKFLNEVESVRKAVEELKRQNINKIIAIGHSGIDIDQKVAKEVEGVDIVVGGHEHALLYTGKQLSLTLWVPSVLKGKIQQKFQNFVL